MMLRYKFQAKERENSVPEKDAVADIMEALFVINVRISRA